MLPISPVVLLLVLVVVLVYDDAAVAAFPPLSVGLRITGFAVGMGYACMEPLFRVVGDGKSDLKI